MGINIHLYGKINISRMPKVYPLGYSVWNPGRLAGDDELAKAFENLELVQYEYDGIKENMHRPKNTSDLDQLPSNKWNPDRAPYFIALLKDNADIWVSISL